MKNNKWNLVWGIIGLIIITLTFVNNNSTKNLFGYELNIWVYRGIWLTISVSNFIKYYKRRGV